MSSREKEEILANVARVVRALITSAKPPVGLQSVIRDYAGIEGEPLPFRRLGYPTVEDMLRDTNEFNFTRNGNEVFISAKYSAKTAHIESMVRAQKKSKSKQVCRPPSQVQKPRPSFNNRGPPSSYQRPPPSFVNRPSPVPHPLLNRTPTVNRPPLTPYPLDYPPSVQHPTVNRPPSNQAPIVSRPPPPQAEDRQQLRDRQIQQDRQAPPRAVNSPQKPPAAGPKLPELDAEVQRVQQELCRVRKQQEEQLRAQQRFEEKERNLQELQDSLLQELQKKLETDLQARIEGQLQARFEKKLQAFREQNERSLREQASALEKLRKERQEQERRDKEKREQEQLERERQLNERNLKEKELRELERRKKERQEQERREKDRQDQERREKDRQDLERREKERRDKERREKEHQEQERREKERQDQERREKERREKERREKDRQDQEQREKERHKLEQREKDRHAPERRKTDPEDLDPTIDVIEYQIKDPKTMRSAKVDQEKILVSIGNGKNGQSHAQSNGQSKPPLRAILGNSAPLRNNNPTTAMSTSYKRPMHPRIPYPGQGRSSGVSVNHRLKQNPPTEDSIPSPKSMPITPPISPESAKVTQAPKVDVLRLQAPQPPKDTRPEKQISIEAYSPDTDLDPVELLKQYCLANQFDEPVYNFFKTPSKLHCSVRIQGEVYSTYPEEFANEKAACERTALVAIDRIKHAEVRKKLAACTITDEDFIDSLYEELQKFPHGILGHKMEVWYSETFGRHLPSHWYDLVVESKKIRVEHGINPRTIIFANAPGSPEPVRIAPPTVMSALELPWQPNDSGSNDWNMYISHCDSTKQVWARLIDDIASFDELTTHMGRHMAVPLFRQQVETPDEGDLYLVEIREGWNRVRVLSVDKEQRSCRCHFVDFGDMAQFQFNDLYRCPPQFLVLPAQAICLSMYALDKFEDHPHALPVLMAELDGQTVVARVLTTPKQFQELGGAAQGLVEKNKRKACLVATLYDTSTAEDIHLNDLVAARITKSTPAPSLNDEKMVVKTSPVLVSHITDDGDLVVLLRNDDLKFVERSIATTVADLGEKDRVRFSDLLHDRHVFVCDESGDGSKQWYRGRLVFKPTNPEEETFDVFYVDDGRQRKTHISNIYRLEANNRALATYPPQALLVGLHDVPDMCGQLLPRLRGLLPPRCEALLKVVVKDGAKPLVNLFIRGNDPESMYMCVNIGLRLEFEMQSSTRPDNYDDLHTSSNYLLPRRNSLSSVVSSQSSGSDLLAVTPPVTPQRASTRGAATTFSTGLLKDYEAIPAIGAFFEVRVSLSINPGHFAVQPYKCYNQLQCLMKELQAHCQGNMAKGVEPSQLAIGEAYAAPDTDGVYHRVNIRKIYDEIIHVRFVDVGDDGVVACEQLKTLPAELRKLPKMGLAAQLYGIQLEDVVWSQENCVRFRKLTLGQKFIGIVRGSHKLKDGSRSLSLELVDTSTPQDIKLHEILINEKHAQPETKEV